jgi:predicted transcriptional regulator
MARELGISASYLNLIEHDRRPLSATLLIRLAQRFDVDVKQFAAETDAQLMAELMEALGDPLFENIDVVTSELREMTAVAPTASRAVTQLYQAYRHVRDSAEGLAARLSEDLALPGVDRSRLPTEEVSSFIQAHLNHFPELEDAADELRQRARLAPDDLLHGMVRFLESEHGVRTRIITASEEGGTVRRYDPERKLLSLSEALPPSSRTFQLAHQLALLTQRELLGQLADEPALSTDESRALGRVILANYFAGAVLMPYETIRRAAREERHDVELLQNRFGATFEMVCHRLTTLQRRGAEGVPFHFVRVDIAGNVSKWFSASGIPIARFGGACPRWNLHTAFLTPGRITVQLSRTIDGQVYFAIARTIDRATRGYHVPRNVQAVTLGCAVEHAGQMVYADRVDLGNLEAAVPIGTTCRLCHQPDCDQRVLPPIEQPLRIHENVRGHSFYNPVRRS